MQNKAVNKSSPITTSTSDENMKKERLAQPSGIDSDSDIAKMGSEIPGSNGSDVDNTASVNTDE